MQTSNSKSIINVLLYYNDILYKLLLLLLSHYYYKQLSILNIKIKQELQK